MEIARYVDIMDDDMEVQQCLYDSDEEFEFDSDEGEDEEEDDDDMAEQCLQNVYYQSKSVELGELGRTCFGKLFDR